MTWFGREFSSLKEKRMDHQPFFDSTQVAGVLGITRNHVARLCKAHGVGRLERKSYRLTQQDIGRLKKVITLGNPGGKKGRPRG